MIRETTRLAQPHTAIRKNIGPDMHIDGKLAFPLAITSFIRSAMSIYILTIVGTRTRLSPFILER